MQENYGRGLPQRRLSRIIDTPRRLIEATGAELVEMPRHGTNTLCCGAGGGQIWIGESDAEGERPSKQRIREAMALGKLDHFSCPKNVAMYTAAAQVVGPEFDVIELTALIELALPRVEAAAAVH